MTLSIAAVAASSLSADSGEAQAVADWAMQQRDVTNAAQLNALPVSASHLASAPSSGLGQWLTDNSTAIIAGCTLLGLLMTLRKQ